MVEVATSLLEVKKEDIIKTIYDLERIVGRISVGSANAKDLVQLRKSLSNIPYIKGLISKLDLSDAEVLSKNIDSHTELYELLDKALVENPPLSIKEGKMIRDGYNKELDEIKDISLNSAVEHAK